MTMINPKGSVGQQTGSGVQGSALGSFVPPSGPFTPLEDHKDWTNITDTGSSGTTLLAGQLTINTTPSGNQAVAFKAINAQDVEISCNLRFISNGPSEFSKILAIRMIDKSQYIGIRTKNGSIELYDYFTGSNTLIGSYVTTPSDIGKILTLKATGSIVNVILGGIKIISVTTNVTHTGRVGVVLRGWTLFPAYVSGNYAASQL